ncbi:MAG TPA: hypothetical protein VE621_24695 [Bryobacteraceae bacterium]|nr:hypothetical protein [Bryobacteraceae bacterium]
MTAPFFMFANPIACLTVFIGGITRVGDLTSQLAATRRSSHLRQFFCEATQVRAQAPMAVDDTGGCPFRCLLTAFFANTME